MPSLDLAAAYVDLGALIAKHGLADSSYCIQVSVWHHVAGAGYDRRVAIDFSMSIHHVRLPGNILRAHCLPTVGLALEWLDVELTRLLRAEAPPLGLDDVRAMELPT